MFRAAVLACLLTAATAQGESLMQQYLDAEKPAELIEQYTKTADLDLDRIEQLASGAALDETPVDDTQRAAKAARSQLVGAVTDAKQHSNEADAIKHSIAVRQARLRSARHQKNVLNDEVHQIGRAHDLLVKSLHKTLDPKLDSARMFSKKHQQRYQNEVDAAKYWEDQERSIKEEAYRMVKDEKAAQTSLQELQSKVTWAKQQEEIAEGKFHYSNQMAKEEAQSLKYAEEQYQSEAARLKNAEDAAKLVMQKVGAQDDIRAMQELEDAQRDVRAKQDEAQDWKDNLDHIREQAAEMSRENMTSFANLQETETQLSWAQQQEKLAEKQFKEKRDMAAQEVETLKNAEHKFAAEVSQLKLAEAGAQAADESVRRLNVVRDREEQKVEKVIANGKRRLRHKMQESEASRARTAHEIDSLQHQYSQWQDSQQQRLRHLDAVKSATQAASDQYAQSLQDEFNEGQEKAYEDELPFIERSRTESFHSLLQEEDY